MRSYKHGQGDVVLLRSRARRARVGQESMFNKHVLADVGLLVCGDACLGGCGESGVLTREGEEEINHLCKPSQVCQRK
jgi:hypothetical protein